MNEFDLSRVNGGNGSHTYVFHNNQRIWGPNHTRVICVNEEVATDNAEFEVPVTVTTPFSSMSSPQHITMTVRLLRDYLNLYGPYEG